MASHVAELETLLAVERAENARRLKEVDGHMRVMRSALQDLQADFRRSSSERERLRMELEEREHRILEMQSAMADLRDKADTAAAEREGAAAEVVAMAISRAQLAESELALARNEVEGLNLRVHELEELGPLDATQTTVDRLERLEEEMARRDEELIRAAETIRDYEERLLESEDRAGRTEIANDRLRGRIELLIDQFEAAAARAEREETRRAETRRAETEARADMLAREASRSAEERASTERDARGVVAESARPESVGTPRSDRAPREPEPRQLTIAQQAALKVQGKSVAALPRRDVALDEEFLTAGVDDEDDDEDEVDEQRRRGGGRAKSKRKARRGKRARHALEATEESGTYIPIADDDVDDDDDQTVEPPPPTPKPARRRAARETVTEDPPLPPPVPRAGATTEPSRGARTSRPAAATQAPPAAGIAIDGLKLEGEAGRGPLGTLFNAREVASRRPVTVRLLPGGRDRPDSARVERLLLVRHRNVVAALAYGSGTAGPYLVSDRAAGERSDHWVERVGALSERIALAVILQVAKGLREAAFHGVVHGGLEPASLHVDASGDVRIEDVGLAGLLRGTQARPSPYVSPERAEGGAPDARCDVFSLGAVLHFLLTGVAPKGALTDGGYDPRQARRDVSDDVAALVGSMTSADPDARPVTWDEVIVDVERRLPGSGSDELRRRSAGGGGLLQAFIRKPHLLVGALAVPALALAAFLHLNSAQQTTPRERFDRAAERAERLVRQGDVEGARRIYMEFLTAPGDAVVERDAARRLDALRDIVR